VTIDVNATSAVGFGVTRDDHVDVLWLLPGPGPRGAVITTLVEDAVVLATGLVSVGISYRPKEVGYGTVTLLVLPEEAERLVLAQKLGSLHLSLRNSEDDKPGGDRRNRTTVNGLLDPRRSRALRERRFRTIQRNLGGKAASTDQSP
jgi:pilus assembly protein CpaB